MDCGRGISLSQLACPFGVNHEVFSHTTRQVCTLAAPALFCTHVTAGVVISGTRVIYPSDAKEVSVRINNVGPSPVLLQSWIDNDDANAKPSAIKVPFV
ncbi:pili/flagellar assembly PapD-like chaperone [Serratia fonticola]|nr:pili/flagellar assembly PapD-like chaperone [Serratia fonticola]